MTEPTFRCKSYTPRNYTGATIFLLTAFGSKSWWYRPVVKKLLSKGFKIYVYDYKTKPLLEAHPEEWVEFTYRLNDHIARNIAADKQKYSSARFGIIGTSVGSVLASHAVKCFEELEKIVFVTIYGSTAQLVWENRTLKKIKSKFTINNLTMRDAAAVFGPLEATSDIEKFGNRPILLFSNMDDRTIKYNNTYRFVKAATEYDLNLTYRLIESSSHMFTIVKVMSNMALWLPFFLDLRNPSLAVPLEAELNTKNSLGTKAEG